MSKGAVTEFALARPLYVWFVVLACLVGGLIGVNNIARLEDPPYPIKQAYVFTHYPGASALEVEQEVTERIEAALQELPWIEKLISRSLAGRSEIQVELYQTVAADQTPQIWDELRRRVNEAAARLPPAALPPQVEDDFSDVYGMLYAVSVPEGYPLAVVQDAARALQVGLKQVRHVAKVQLEGVPEERIYIDFDVDRLARLGIPFDQLIAAVRAESVLNPGSAMHIGERRFFTQTELPEEAITALEAMQLTVPGVNQQLLLSELATISRGETDQPRLLIHHNGERVFTVGIAVADTENIAEIGRHVEQRIERLAALLPLGMEVHPIYQQHLAVDEAVDTFLANLSLSVLTVIAALCVFMGWRAGIVVGSVLLVTVLGTIAVMAALDIQLHRISLGAVMIAMGMLVDNAIVIAEAMMTGIQRGFAPRTAAVESVEHTQFPLLGATLIGIAAFAPIGLSADSTGQFLGSLFQVSGIALFLSWVLAITMVPSLGARLFRPVKTGRVEADIYSGLAYRIYRQLLTRLLHWKTVCTLALLAIIVVSLYGFGQLKQGFFPTTNTPLFFVDVQLPQGTDIAHTDATLRRVEQALRAHPEVTTVSSWTGRGPSRFTMIMLPERPNPSYGQVVLRVVDVSRMNEVMTWSRQQLAEHFPEIQAMVRRSEFTTGSASKIEVRFSGPDRAVLRALGDQALDAFMRAGLTERSVDWLQPELALQPRFDPDLARRLGVSRTDVANSLAFATNGIAVAEWRDADKAVPIIARLDQRMPSLSELADKVVWSQSEQRFLPLRQVINGIAVSGQDGIIMRRNRSRTLTVRANPVPGEQASEAFARVQQAIEVIPLPPGYSRRWGGEYEANQVANEAVISKFPIAMVVMILTTLLMFGRIRQTLVIWLTVPLTLSGVTLGLHVSQLSFTFPALLGLLSLVGILIKNSVVLVEEIDFRLGDSDAASLSVLANACVSRLRPVMLAAGTTIAGMLPLLNDTFFREMAVSIMGGLAMGSAMSLISVPVLYALMYRQRIRSDADETTAAIGVS